MTLRSGGARSEERNDELEMGGGEERNNRIHFQVLPGR